MPHSIGGLEIEERLTRAEASHGVVDGRGRAVREEDRAGLGADCYHVPRAIVFLVPPRALVLLDDIAVVLLERPAPRDAGLLVSSHSEPIQIDARLVFHDQRRST